MLTTCPALTKSCCIEWLEAEEVEKWVSEQAVVGWLWGQCVTLGCPGAPKREVSHSKEASDTQYRQYTGNAYLTIVGSSHGTLPLMYIFVCLLLISFWFTKCVPLLFSSPAFSRALGVRGSVGILAPCALRSTEPWLRSISPLYPLLLLWLPPLLLPTKHPSPLLNLFNSPSLLP